MPYHHGVQVLEVTEGPRQLAVVATAVIGLVAIATDADAAMFPLNTPVRIINLPAAIAKAGVQGTLSKALKAIADQASTAVVVVRVADVPADEEATQANVVAGVQKLQTAANAVGLKPRILGAPGLDDDDAVATELATTAKKLRAMAYAKCVGATIAEKETYRETFAARELMLIDGDFQAYDVVAKATVTLPAVAVALGLRAAIDQTQGYWKTLSNVAVNGVTGIVNPLTFDLQDPDTEVGQLNEAGITCLINYGGGFRFWGSRTCSDDPKFVFESATRIAQVLADTCAEGLLWAVDKPHHPSLMRDVIESIRARIRTMIGKSLIGGDAWFNETENTAANLAAGEGHVDYDFTPVPPLENLTLRQRITDRYFSDFATQVNA